jgi:3-methyl-2-oxobutanoate hydroxymethyltransferase
MSDFIVSRLKRKRKRTEPIVSITAYDYFTALLAREADADFVLVGDSLGNVIHGEETTVKVELSDIIYHTRIVCRHFPPGRVVLDMPFGTFKLDAAHTIGNSVRAFKESGCGAVKFEGASPDNLEAISALREIGIPVLGHIGLQPQRVHSEGGFRMQGKTAEAAREIMFEARELERAGAFAVVLECVVPEVAARISSELAIPTIGIGSGPDCDGQIIVMHDILGMLPGEAPSFARQYANLFADAVDAVGEYARDTRERRFPEPRQPRGKDKLKVYGGGESGTS